MNAILDDAIRHLRWGSTQKDVSVSISPAQCKALLELVDAEEVARESDEAAGAPARCESLCTARHSMVAAGLRCEKAAGHSLLHADETGSIEWGECNGEPVFSVTFNRVAIEAARATAKGVDFPYGEGLL